MAEVVENTENTENETPAVPQMSTVERAEMLLKQDATIREKIKSGATLDEAVDPSNKEFGPLAHPEQVQMRVAKRAMMLEAGIAPYPVHLDVTDTIEAVRAKYDGKLEAGDETEDVVGIAGRVLFLRNAGGLCFVQLSAGDGTKIQGMISKKEIGADSLKQFKQLVDLGDHLFIKGRVIASKTGELSVFATEWAIAAKALQPLPALHKDLNEDTRTRKPYIGMIADEKIRNMVRNRSKAVASLRKTFADHDFLEVETPMLQTVHGGAAARPFTTHMNAFDLDLYLRIAPELFLKRCLVGGIDRVFEINRDFRNEGVDATHAPEFTMVEAYQAYGNYDTIGALVKQLVQDTAMDVFGSHKVTLLDGTEYDFGGEWKTISMYDSLSEALGEEIVPNGGPDNPGTSVEHLGEIADKLGVERDDVENHGKLVEHLWEHFYEDKLYEPTFVRLPGRDLPAGQGPPFQGRRGREVGSVRARLRTGHRLLRAQRPGRAARTLRGPGQGRARRRRGGLRHRRGLPGGPRRGHASGRWHGNGHRPTAHRTDRRHHPRDHHLPACEAAELRRSLSSIFGFTRGGRRGSPVGFRAAGAILKK